MTGCADWNSCRGNSSKSLIKNSPKEKVEFTKKKHENKSTSRKKNCVTSK